ncbi:hypothetical protein CSUI_007181 [Cystoisospora suis]|uniref:Transmembrane protein n=1 Tax=Cystoisospora suis TaxID=483139 RepID=A0A2C6KER8_9APIC|nr:hypothetical protein CSUI_007181 [Cystoisospora suis]
MQLKRKRKVTSSISLFFLLFPFPFFLLYLNFLFSFSLLSLLFLSSFFLFLLIVEEGEEEERDFSSHLTVDHSTVCRASMCEERRKERRKRRRRIDCSITLGGRELKMVEEEEAEGD